MKKINLILTFLVLFTGAVSGQYASVNFDLEKNYFNEGQPLPAEKKLMFSGVVPQDVDIIEISIFPNKTKNEKNRLYLAAWKDADDAANANFSLAVNYPLRASEKYDFRFDYYTQLDGPAKRELGEHLTALANAHLRANISLKEGAVALAKSERRIALELDKLVQDALGEYRSQDGLDFAGFSPTIRQKLEQMTGQAATFSEKMPDLEATVAAEIRQLMDKQWSKLSASRYVDDYETEQKKGTFSINAGYGGVYIGGNLDDFTYGASPYLGLSFPLANSTLAPKFMRNSSLTVGAFVQNFKDAGNHEVSGVLVDRPIYLGLDYKLFEFVRFNAGAAFLEKNKVDDNGGETQVIFIRPFVGLSARVDLSIGFGK